MGDRLQTDKSLWYIASHLGQLSLAIPPWMGAMSTSENRDVNRYTARCTSPVYLWSRSVSWCLAEWYENEDQRRVAWGSTSIYVYSKCASALTGNQWLSSWRRYSICHWCDWHTVAYILYYTETLSFWKHLMSQWLPINRCCSMSSGPQATDSQTH